MNDFSAEITSGNLYASFKKAKLINSELALVDHNGKEYYITSVDLDVDHTDEFRSRAVIQMVCVGPEQESL